MIWRIKTKTLALDAFPTSISHAVGVLRDGGFLTVDQDGFLHLTGAGLEVAEKIYERHQFFTQWLIGAGIDPETAEQDACRMEQGNTVEYYQLPGGSTAV